MTTTTDPRDSVVELPGMPERIPGPKYDGVEFRAIKLAFAGGVEIEIDETTMELLRRLKLGQAFDLKVSGIVTAKKPTVKPDPEWGHRTGPLTITLTVDSIDGLDQ